MTLILLLTGRHRHRLAAALALPVLMFYTLLTGASPSVVRACIMVVFVLAAPLFQRDSDPPTTLSAALFLILLANPFAAASISLQLSFGAMAGLLWLTPKLQDLLLGERPSGRSAGCWFPACRPPWGPWHSRCPCALSTSGRWY
ncbi:MAG: ComEC/Rec2 family competence protein [Dysosmobacter welbionis]